MDGTKMERIARLKSKHKGKKNSTDVRLPGFGGFLVASFLFKYSSQLIAFRTMRVAGPFGGF
jgi:hypothetical protein